MPPDPFFPAILQVAEDRFHFFDLLDGEVIAGVVQTINAVVVKIRQAQRQLAAFVKIKRAGQRIEDIDALVDALRLTLIATRRNVAFGAYQLIHHAAEQHQHQLVRVGCRRLNRQIGLLIQAVAFLLITVH